MTRPELLAYVATLEPEVQRLFQWADGYVRDHDDTLTEEWQIAAAIMAVFEERAKERAGTLKVVEAGVGPSHQTDHCDHCKRIFWNRSDSICTCDASGFLTLCTECYLKAGNSVR